MRLDVPSPSVLKRNRSARKTRWQWPSMTRGRASPEWGHSGRRPSRSASLIPRVPSLQVGTHVERLSFILQTMLLACILKTITCKQLFVFHTSLGRESVTVWCHLLCCKFYVDNATKSHKPSQHPLRKYATTSWRNACFNHLSRINTTRVSTIVQLILKYRHTQHNE